MPLTTGDGLEQARALLNGRASGERVPEAIHASWNRCLAAGLDPHGTPAPIAVGAHVLGEAREQHDYVRRLALVEMESLYQQIAGTNFMVAFAAPNGLVLDTIADGSFTDMAAKTNIGPGAQWTEARCGTNALGTSVETGVATVVHGAEHFFRCLADLTCTAAPIFDPQGNLAGVLDASSNCRSRQQHTGALVQMAATQVENGLLRERLRGDMIVQVHNRPEYLHTLSAGLLALDDQGVVLAANAQFRFLLQGLPAVPGRQFHELFRTRFAAFRDAALRGEVVHLEDRVGSVFAARAENLPRSRGIQVPAAQKPVAVKAAVHRFVAEDADVASVVRQVEAAVARNIPILIRGETGTGKEQLARHAHLASGRRGAFVPVNCAALPDSLVESELFGHADGAFTGARRGGAGGLVAEADGGTLFLDEIGEMRRELQAVLLRLLDDWTVRPVGGGRRRQVDVQLVSATNIDIDAAIASGAFRADLYWRLNTLEVTLKALRDRSDVGAIARHLLGTLAPEAHLTDEAITALSNRSWSGNMRELRSVLARATLTVTEGTVDALLLGDPSSGTRLQARQPGLRNLLREKIADTHRQTRGNVSETARRLGVSRNTVYRALTSATN